MGVPALVTLPQGSQSYTHGPLTRPPHLGRAWGLVSFHALVVELEGPGPHFPRGRHVHLENSKNNQSVLRERV